MVTPRMKKNRARGIHGRRARRSAGVRLLYDVFYPLPSGLRLGLRAGYAARDQFIGGATGGLSASYDF